MRLSVFMTNPIIEYSSIYDETKADDSRPDNNKNDYAYVNESKYNFHVHDYKVKYIWFGRHNKEVMYNQSFYSNCKDDIFDER